MVQIEIEGLKQIYFKETGEQLSDQKVQEMGIRLLQLFKIIGKEIPENSQELDK